NSKPGSGVLQTARPRGGLMPKDFVRRERPARSILVFLALTVISESFVMAQTGGTGALSGTVSDSSGAVVGSVKVTAISAGTGQSRTATTGADGSYTFNLLQPGNYRLRF